MAQPTPYERQYNFSNYQTASPSEPLPGAQVDIELNAVKATLDQTLDNLALIQRDDGQIANNTIGFDQLKAEVEIGVNPPSAWATLTNYAVSDTVTFEAGFYRCLIAHVSGVFATDLAALKWELIVDFADTIGEAAIEDALHSALSKAVPIDGDEFMGNDSADSYTLRRFNFANIKSTIVDAIGVLLNSTTAKSTPVDADQFLIGDSAATNANKKLTFGNLKAAIFGALGAAIAALTGKTTPVDADTFAISDSAASDASKKLTWANLKATFFASLGALITAATGKTTPADADTLVLNDSAASDTTKKLTWANVKATLKTYFDTLYAALGAGGVARNRLVNPAMQISSINGNTAGTTNAYSPADNWAVYRVTSAGTITVQRVQSVTPKGAKDRIRVTITVQDASLAAGEYLTVTQNVVGQEVADFRYGSASAKQSILRFLFKGPAGTYAVSLKNTALNRSYVALFTPAAANTDEVISLTIPGDTSGTWPTDTSIWTLDIVLACGSTFQGTTGWQAGNILGTSGVSNGMGTAAAVFEVGEAGWYLDASSTGVAPTWELPSQIEVTQTINGGPAGQLMAWVNFDGTGTVSIRASGNVSSLTDNGSGDYTVNFTTAMPSANYGAVATSVYSSAVSQISIAVLRDLQAGSVRVQTGAESLSTAAIAPSDSSIVCVSIFR